MAFNNSEKTDMVIFANFRCMTQYFIVKNLLRSESATGQNMYETTRISLYIYFINHTHTVIV
jgi:hypothetical protein